MMVTTNVIPKCSISSTSQTQSEADRAILTQACRICCECHHSIHGMCKTHLKAELIYGAAFELRHLDFCQGLAAGAGVTVEGYPWLAPPRPAPSLPLTAFSPRQTAAFTLLCMGHSSFSFSLPVEKKGTLRGCNYVGCLWPCSPRQTAVFKVPCMNHSSSHGQCGHLGSGHLGAKSLAGWSVSYIQEDAWCQ